MELDNNIGEIKSYLKKINAICNTEAKFSFGCWRLVEKERIDDLLCCFISMLPKEYLNITKNPKLNKNCKSILAYEEFLNVIKTPFILNKKYYIVNNNQIEKLMSFFIINYPSDLNYIKKLFE